MMCGKVIGHASNSTRERRPLLLLLIFALLFAAPFLMFRPRDPFQPECILNSYFVGMIGIGPVILRFVAPGLYQAGNFAYISFLIGLGYVSINLGFGFSRLIGGAGNVKLPGQGRWVTWMFHYRRTFRALIGACLALGLLGAIAFFGRARQIPLFQRDKEAARVAALSVSGNGYCLYIMTVSMIGVLLAAALLYGGPQVYLTPKKERRLVLLALVVGLVMLLTGSRRYLLATLFYVILARHYLYRRVRLGWLFTLAVAGLIGINLFEMFRDPNSATTVSFSTTAFYRFIIYISNFQKVFRTFDVSGNRMWGQTFIMDLLTIAPGKQQDYQSWLKDQTGLTFEGFGIPPTIVGDMFINFGTIGVVIGCFVFGSISRWIYDKLVIKEAFSGISIVYYALLIETMMKMLTSGLSAQSLGIIWSSGVVCTIFYVFRTDAIERL
jgi:oligosaccharide repeat unit polymerase